MGAIQFSDMRLELNKRSDPWGLYLEGNLTESTTLSQAGLDYLIENGNYTGTEDIKDMIHNQYAIDTALVEAYKINWGVVFLVIGVAVVVVGLCAWARKDKKH